MRQRHVPSGGGRRSAWWVRSGRFKPSFTSLFMQSSRLTLGFPAPGDRAAPLSCPPAPAASHPRRHQVAGGRRRRFCRHRSRCCRCHRRFVPPEQLGIAALLTCGRLWGCRQKDCRVDHKCGVGNVIRSALCAAQCSPGLSTVPPTGLAARCASLLRGRCELHQATCRRSGEGNDFQPNWKGVPPACCWLTRAKARGAILAIWCLCHVTRNF